jgi:hypothetical protein
LNRLSPQLSPSPTTRSSASPRPIHPPVSIFPRTNRVSSSPGPTGISSSSCEGFHQSNNSSTLQLQVGTSWGISTAFLISVSRPHDRFRTCALQVAVTTFPFTDSHTSSHFPRFSSIRFSGLHFVPHTKFTIPREVSSFLADKALPRVPITLISIGFSRPCPSDGVFPFPGVSTRFSVTTAP